MSPVEKVIFDTLAVHWMSAISGVCTCGEVMFDRRKPREMLKAVVTHRTKVITEALEAAQLLKE